MIVLYYVYKMVGKWDFINLINDFTLSTFTVFRFVKEAISMGGSPMTDNQLKHLNRLYQFIRKLLRLVPQESREQLEEEFDKILQDNIES